MGRLARALGVCGLSVGIVAGLGIGPVEAASGDADGTYTVTVTKIEVSKDAGATYTTVFSGSQDINIAAVDAGAVAAGLVSGVTMEPGTYTHMKVSIGANLILKGFLNIGATNFYTDGATFGNRTGSTPPDTGYTTSTFATGSPTTTFSTLSMAINPGASSKAQVKFDTSGVIVNSGGSPSVNPPVVDVSVQ